MNEPVYNSLSEQLKQSGILSFQAEIDNNNVVNNPRENFFKTSPDKDYEDDKNTSGTEVLKEPKANSKKRINEYDLNLMRNNNSNQRGQKAPLAKILKRFFPTLYKVKIAKEAAKRLCELNIDTNTFLNKTIPYGENETRYEAIVKYLNYANEIQTKLNENS